MTDPDTPTPPVPSPWRVLVRGAVVRCPSCGSRGVRDGWFALRSLCPSCEIGLIRGEGYWLGGMAINLVVTQAALLGTLIGGMLLLWPDVPWIRLTVVCAAVTVATPIVFFPVSRTLWVAVDFLLHRMDRQDESRWLEE